MTSRHCAAALIVVLIAASTGLAAYAQEAAPTPTPVPESIPVLSGATEPYPESTRIWFENGEMIQGMRASIAVKHPESCDGNTSVEFGCEVNCELQYQGLSVNLEIANEQDVVLFSAALPMDLAAGLNTCRFEWDPASLPTGLYTALFTLERGPQVWVSYKLGIRKLSNRQLKDRLDRAVVKVQEIDGILAAMREKDIRPAYIFSRIAIARDFAPLAVKEINGDDWRQGERLTRYILDTVDSVRAMLALGGSLRELSNPAPQVDAKAIITRDGSFWSNDKRVFLVGVSGWDSLPSEMPKLSQYGLNFVAARPSGASEFNATLKAAAENNLSVLGLAGISPDAQAEDILKPADYTYAENRSRIEGRLRGLCPAPDDTAVLRGICMMDRAAFSFTDEDTRKQFIEHVKSIYKDYDAVNWSWQSRFAKLDNIDISPEYKHPSYKDKAAYQYDWQTFQRGLGHSFFSWYAACANAAIPATTHFTLACAGVFDNAETRSGVSHPAALSFSPIAGCALTAPQKDPSYAFAHREQGMTTTLLRALAPGKPIVAVRHHLFPADAAPGPDDFRFAHSAIWDAVMAGVSGTAVYAWEPETTRDDLRRGLAYRPEAIEGISTAALDVNRLADIVGAMQQAEAPIAILWSDTSKLYGDGETYLASVRKAYEGVSFGGYKARFITEQQCTEGELANVRVLVVPHALAVSDSTFDAIKKFIAEGRPVIRNMSPIPYNERGQSRRDMLENTPQTVFVRGREESTDYLAAIDGVLQFKVLPDIPRIVNRYGYPIEGIKSQYVDIQGVGFLYVLNLRPKPISAYIWGERDTGRDLIQACDATFPCVLDPLRPMMIRLDDPKSPKTKKTKENALTLGHPPVEPSTQPQLKGEPPSVQLHTGPLEPVSEDNRPTAQMKKRLKQFKELWF